MKKVFYTIGVLAFVSITVFTGCKKINEGPFPAKPSAGGVTSDLAYTTPTFPNLSDASGILIAAQVHNLKTVIVTPFQNNYEYGMAKFTSTPGSFSNLIDVDSIWINGTNLAKSSTFSYLSSTSTFSLNFSNSTSWKLKGNGNIPGFTYSLSGAYPTYTDSFQKWGDDWLPTYPRTLPIVPTRPTVTHLPSHSDPNFISDSTYYYANLSTINTYLSDSTLYSINTLYNTTPQFTIPIKYTVTTPGVINADSVYIIFSDGAGFLYQRKVPATDSIANFAPNDFAGYPSYNVSSFIMQLNAIKYKDTVINSKNYYFLKMGSYIKYYGATK
ncbi:MAG: hypothetical protein ACYDCN_05535 [Bacteroidia bacterium]